MTPLIVPVQQAFSPGVFLSIYVGDIEKGMPQLTKDGSRLIHKRYQT